MTSESWVDIIGYEGLYKISNTGIIINCKNKRILFGSIKKKTGLRAVTLCKDGITKTYMMHRLVAKHFIKSTKSGVRLKKQRSNCHVDNISVFENHKDLKTDRVTLDKHYESLDKSKWWPMQKEMYKFYQTQDSKYISFIFNRSYKKWLGHIIKLTKNEYDARDILQNCYEQFIESVNEGRFRIDKCYVDYSPDVWIVRIVRNQTCTWLKNKNKSILVDEFYNLDSEDYDDIYNNT